MALIQLAVADPITRFSRNRAIANSAPLIAEIERHRAAFGRYPPSLLAVWPDYWPRIIGIREYRYEPSGSAYNLMFEQPTLRLGMREFVIYNPRGEQTMTAHALDVLQLTPEQMALEHTRGHNELHDAEHPGWKSFRFD